jgi:hypothetical protein
VSTIRLKKDHNGKRAGTVCSVPFDIGKQLLAQGIAEYAPGGRSASVSPPPATAKKPAEEPAVSPPAAAEEQKPAKPKAAKPDDKAQPTSFLGG